MAAEGFVFAVAVEPLFVPGHIVGGDQRRQGASRRRRGSSRWIVPITWVAQVAVGSA